MLDSEEPIDFSKVPRIFPRPDSFGKVLDRIENASIDFSKMTRITPRADSWKKVLERIAHESGEEKISFADMPTVNPKADSWNKVLDRIEEKREHSQFILFRKISTAAIAASILLVAGALFTGIKALNASEASTFSEESYSWYSSLGSGESISTFASVFDNYYLSGEE